MTLAIVGLFLSNNVYRAFAEINCRGGIHQGFDPGVAEGLALRLCF